ncbi:MAG: GGDEF domain-containing protein [Candidatus Aminicenantes bacterium]|nr:GGDEF domain-containing protein [Candidatus Aminicenantes bacterium]
MSNGTKTANNNYQKALEYIIDIENILALAWDFMEEVDSFESVESLFFGFKEKFQHEGNFEEIYLFLKRGEEYEQITGENINLLSQSNRFGDKNEVKAILEQIYGGTNFIIKEIKMESEITGFLAAVTRGSRKKIKYNASEILHLFMQFIRLKVIEKKAVTDRMTQLFNRGYMDELLKNEYERAKRYKRRFCVIMLDIDNFKSINTVYGYSKGDIVIKKISNVLRDSVREVDSVGRWGGEEFFIILPETGLDEAVVIAERIRDSVEKITFEEIDKRVTITAGVAQSKEKKDCSQLVKRVGKLLLEGKNLGKNMVITEEDSPEAK